MSFYDQSTILIVDDEPVGRSSLQALLSREDYRLEFAPDGPTALRLAQEILPDLLLLDVMMPGMDGYEVARKIRATPALAEMPIILVTALDEPASRLAGIEAGADDFISKPFDRVELRARVRTITRLNRFRRIVQEREKYQLLFERSPCGLLLVDPNLKILDTNPAAKELLARVAAPGAATLADLVAESDLLRVRGLVSGAQWTRTTQKSEFQTRTPDHQHAWIQILIAPFPYEGKEAFQVALFDLTAQRTLEEQLRQSQKMESMGLMAGGVAHDFNNLLTVIMGYSELLLERSSVDSKPREQVQQILSTSRRAADLTRQLLAFSRKQVLAIVSLDLNALVTDVETMLRRILREDIELKLALAPTAGVIKADRSQVEQMLLNLVVNARDAILSDGTIAIETRAVDPAEIPPHLARVLPSGRYAVLSVSDTGSGMSKETLARIYEPFFTTKEQGKGTGLGLSMVHGIIRQLGGAIDVASEVGRGTRFSLYLPQATEPAVGTRAETERPSPHSGTGTVLVVDDDEGVRTLTCLILEEAGYTVVQAQDGDDALRVGEEYKAPIHLLATDLVMPKRSGPDVALQMRTTRPALRVMYMSGYADDTVQYQNLSESPAVFLQKPFSPEALLTKVREALA